MSAASSLDDPEIFLTLPIDGDAPADDALGELRSVVMAPAVSRWLDAYLNLRQGRPAGEIDPAPSESMAVLLGIGALRTGDLERAGSVFARAATTAPEALSPKLGSALTYLLGQRLATGLRALESLRDAGRDHPVIDYFIGRVRLLRGESDAAIGPLEASVRAGLPLDARFSLARAYALSERTDEAFAVYGTIVDAQPDSYRARLAVALLAKHLSDRAYFSGLQLAEGGAAGGAAQVQDALTKERMHYEPVALAELDVARRLRPGDPGALRQVGEILRRQQDLDAAAAIFASLSRRFPADAGFFYRLGTVESERGRLEVAARALETALRLARSDADAHQALGIVRLRQGEAALAAELLEAALLFEPFNPAIFKNLGVARARIGELEAAAQAFERELELGTFPLPRRHLTLFNLARVRDVRGDQVGWKRELARALHVKPDFAAASAWLGGKTPPVEYLPHELFERFGEVTTVSLGR